MSFARILITGTALAFSAAFAAPGTQTEQPFGGQAIQDSQPRSSGEQIGEARENPWFNQGENPWSNPNPGAPGAATEPHSTLSELGEPPTESSAIASSPSSSDSEALRSTPDSSSSEAYSPPMGLGSDYYRS